MNIQVRSRRHNIRSKPGLSVVAGGALAFALRDDFTTDESAPLTSPRTAEPGPGTLTITDTENNLSINGEKLVFAGGKTSPAFGDPHTRSDTSWARTAGRVMAASTVTPATDAIGQIGWGAIAGGSVDSSMITFENDGNMNMRSGGDDLRAYANDAVLDIAVILRGTGAFGVVRPSGGEWTLLWPEDALTQSPLYAEVLSYDAAYSIDHFRVTDLPAPWDTDYGISSERHAGSVSAGATFTHEGDMLAEATVGTLPSSGTVEFRFRIQDSSNYWRWTVNSSGDVDLDEVVSGSATQRGTSAAAVSAGNRIVVIADGTTIRVYVANSLEITYGSASNFQNETDGELESLGTGGAVSDIVLWPRTLTGTAANLLDEAVA